jgi:hypothetical protein
MGMDPQSLTDAEKAAYSYFLRQLYEATTGVLLAGAVSTGDTTPTNPTPWDKLNQYERAHFGTHVVPCLVPLQTAVYCINDWAKDKL